MLTSELVILALNDSEDEYIIAAGERMGYITPDAHARTGAKRIITLALAAALVLGLGAAAYAVGVHAGFFRAVFGTGVSGQTAYATELTDPDGNHLKTEKYPAIERADMDEERAEDVAGAYVSAVGQSVSVGQFTFTVREAIVDADGIGALTVDVDAPNGHGLNRDGSFINNTVPESYFGYSIQSSSGEMIASRDYPAQDGYTDTHIAYAYAFAPPKALAPDESVVLRFYVRTGGDSQEADIVIPTAERVPTVHFTAEGLAVSISPVGMTLRFENARNNGEWEEYVTGNIELSFADGSRYTVKGDGVSNIMVSTADTENVGILKYTFNRLVDVDTVHEISVSAVHCTLTGEEGEHYILQAG